MSPRRNKPANHCHDNVDPKPAIWDQRKQANKERNRLFLSRKMREQNKVINKLRKLRKNGISRDRR